jgi:hypothetical protein
MRGGDASARLRPPHPRRGPCSALRLESWPNRRGRCRHQPSVPCWVAGESAASPCQERERERENIAAPCELAHGFRTEGESCHTDVLMNAHRSLVLGFGLSVLSALAVAPSPSASSHPSPPAAALQPLAQSCPATLFFVDYGVDCDQNCTVGLGTFNSTSLGCGGCAGSVSVTLSCDSGTVTTTLSFAGPCNSASRRKLVYCPNDPSTTKAMVEIACPVCQ